MMRAVTMIGMDDGNGDHHCGGTKPAITCMVPFWANETPSLFFCIHRLGALGYFSVFIASFLGVNLLPSRQTDAKLALRCDVKRELTRFTQVVQQFPCFR